MPGTAARRTATGTRRTTGTTTWAFGLPELRRWSGCFARRNRPLFPFRCRRCVADKSLPGPRPVLVASAKALDGLIVFRHKPKKWQISAAPIRDRSVQHSLTGVLEPIFSKAFIADSNSH